MPPRRPLSDVDLISVLKFLKPMDQLKASKMSPRLKLLVRAANRRVKTLVITDQSLFQTQQVINSFFISSEPNLQQLTDGSGKAIDFQPKAVRVTQWNSLKFFMPECQKDLPTVEEIATVLFSAVTSLVFIGDEENNYYLDKNCQYVVSLLQHLPWATQLESLVLRLVGTFFDEETKASKTYELMAALNTLPTLQQLVVGIDLWFDVIEGLPALTVLAQLKVLVVRMEDIYSTDFFLEAIAKQAANIGSLQIHLQVYSALNPLSNTDHLSELLFNRVVRLGEVKNIHCPLFPSLTSLSLSVRQSFSANYFPLIAALSQHNRQLLHLGWVLNLVDEQNLDRSSEQPPLPTLTSVRALTLELTIEDHSQVEWLCLPGTLPNCQAIHLQNFFCTRCQVSLFLYLGGHHDKTNNSILPNSATALQCLREVLSKLYPHFQRQRITLGEEPPYRTAAELFAEK